MKKLEVILTFVFILNLSLIAAASCDLDLTLASQDPAIAVPGEYVKLIFQLDGISNSECKEVGVEFVEEFPFYLDKSQEKILTIHSGYYVSSFPDFMIAPFKVYVDEDAIEGNNTLKINYFSFKSEGKLQKEFTIDVEEVRTEFEVNIKEYDAAAKELTLEILNIGKEDAEAVTIEILRTENNEVFGTNKKIVGDISSKDDELIKFTGNFQEGTIPLTLEYSDQIKERRTVELEVYFDKQSYLKSVDSSSGMSGTTGFIIGIVLTLIILFSWNYYKKRKTKHKLKHRH